MELIGQEVHGQCDNVSASDSLPRNVAGIILRNIYNSSKQ